MRIPTWYHPIVTPWRHRTTPGPAVRWWALPLAMLCGLGALGTLWAASLTRDAAPTPQALSPAQAMADGQHAFQRGDFAVAVTSWQQAAHLSAAAQQPQARSVALSHLARAYAALGHADRAEDSLRTALPLAEQVGDQAQVALILGHLGELALSTGQVTEAERLVHEALGRAQTLEDAGLTATLMQTQGNVLMVQQHWPNALATYRDSARVAQQAGHGGMAVRALVHAAMAAERAGQPRTATALLEDALVLLRQEPPSYDTTAELLVIANDSDLRVSPRGTGNGGNVTVHAERLTLANGSRILTSSFGAGHGGTLSVAARDSISIRGRGNRDLASGLFSNTFGRGNGGRVFVSTPTLTMADGAIQAGTNEGSRGHAGGADVRVERLTLSGGAQIGSTTFGAGRGGQLTITATESITIGGPGGVGIGPGGEPVVIQSGLFSNADSSGDAGPLFVSTPLLSLEGGRIVSRTLGEGNAGDLEIQTRRLTLTGGGQIFSGIGTFEGDRVIGTNGLGRGGKVTVRATDSIRIEGRGQGGFQSAIASNAQIGRGRAGDVVIATPSLEMRDGFISTATSTQATGNAGNIVLEVGRLTLADGAQISSLTSSAGRGGTVQVTATDTLTLAGTSSDGIISGILASAAGRDMDAGAAGSIVVQAPRVALTGGAQIGSGTFGPGQGGTVQVTATDTLTLAGISSDGRFPSGILASAEGRDMGAGAAGSIVVQAPRVALTGGEQIGSGTFSPGQGGAVRVTATDTLTLTGTAPGGAGSSGILASAEGEAVGAGAAGTVVVEARNVILTDGAEIGSSTFGPGQGGMVTVTATDAVTVKGSASGIFARALSTGNAGQVLLSTPMLQVSEGAVIDSSTSGAGLGGILLCKPNASR